MVLLLALGACAVPSEEDLSYLGRSSAEVQTNPASPEKVAVSGTTLCVKAQSGFWQGKDLQIRLEAQIEKLFEQKGYKVEHDCAEPDIKADILALAQASKKEVAGMVAAGYGAAIPSQGIISMDMTQDRMPASLGPLGLLGQFIRDGGKDSMSKPDTVRFLLVDVQIHIDAKKTAFRFAAQVPYNAPEDWRNQLFAALDERLLALI